MNFDKLSEDLMWGNEMIRKYADYDLGDNPQIWVSKIRAIFEKQHPELIEAGGVPNIAFYKKDFVRGNAIGALTITVNTTYMIFPIVIREKALAPFDTVYVDKHWHFADKDLMLDLMQEYNLFSGISDKPTSPGTTSVPVSSFGRFSYPSSGALTLLSSYNPVTQDGRDKLASLIVDNPSIYAHSTSEFKSFMSKIASGEFSAVNGEPHVSPESDFDVVLIRQNDLDSYNVKLAHAGCGGYLNYNLSFKETKGLVSKFIEKDAEKIMESVDANPGRGVLIETAPDADVSDPIYEQPGAARMAGSYNVVTENGYRTIGIVYPVISWDFEATPNKLFMNAEFWALQPTIAGTPASTAFIAPIGSLKDGSQGVFVYRKNGKAFSTPPIELEEVTMGEDGVSVKAYDLMTQQQLNFLIVKDIRAIMKIDPEKHPSAFDASRLNLYLPQDMEYIELPATATHIIQDPGFVLKLSAFLADQKEGEKVKVIRDSVDHFVVDTGKYDYVEYPERITKSSNYVPWDRIENCDRTIASFRLATLGAGSIEKISKVLSDESTYSSLILPFATKLAHNFVREHRVENMTKEAGASWEKIYDTTVSGKIDPLDILKIAAQISDNTTLDGLLSLNFLNKDTIEYFVSHSEMLNDLEEFLSKLLLAERVSSFGVDEDSILRTLKGLSEIQEGFKGLAGRS
jgi:hypothetical protein